MGLRKLLMAAVLATLLPAPGRADAPSLISYQGVLMQDNGIVVGDGLYNLRFRIFPQAVGGTTPLFQQTLAVEVRKGLYNVILSDQNGYDLLQIFRDNAQLFMEVAVLGLGSPPSDVVLQPRQQLVSVPYALATRGGQTDAVVPSVLATQTTMSEQQTPTWRTIPGLNPIDISAPAPKCHLRVRASVTLAVGGGSPLVGVQLERSTGTDSPQRVRGPLVAFFPNGNDVTTLVLEHVVRDAPPNVAYTYRVTAKEDNGNQAFVVSPNVSGIGQTESSIEGQVWCP